MYDFTGALSSVMQESLNSGFTYKCTIPENINTKSAKIVQLLNNNKRIYHEDVKDVALAAKDGEKI